MGRDRTEHIDIAQRACGTCGRRKRLRSIEAIFQETQDAVTGSRTFRSSTDAVADTVKLPALIRINRCIDLNKLRSTIRPYSEGKKTTSGGGVRSFEPVNQILGGSIEPVGIIGTKSVSDRKIRRDFSACYALNRSRRDIDPVHGEARKSATCQCCVVIDRACPVKLDDLGFVTKQKNAAFGPNGQLVAIVSRDIDIHLLRDLSDKNPLPFRDGIEARPLWPSGVCVQKLKLSQGIVDRGHTGINRRVSGKPHLLRLFIQRVECVRHIFSRLQERELRRSTFWGQAKIIERLLKGSEHRVKSVWVAGLTKIIIDEVEC